MIPDYLFWVNEKLSTIHIKNKINVISETSEGLPAAGRHFSEIPKCMYNSDRLKTCISKKTAKSAI